MFACCLISSIDSAQFSENRHVTACVMVQHGVLCGHPPVLFGPTFEPLGYHQSWHGGSYTSSQWDICCLQNFRREFCYSYSQRYQCEKSMASVSRFLTFLQSGCRCSRVPRLPLPQQLHADLDTLATSSVTSVQFLMVGPICNTLSHLVLCNIRKPLINLQRWIACNLSSPHCQHPTTTSPNDP